MTSWVYFIRPVGMDGPVKIGLSTNPDLRLIDYERHSPVLVEIAALIEGDKHLEARFHNAFRDQHWQREWFHPSAELTETVRLVAAGTFDIEALPEPRRVICPREAAARSNAARKAWQKRAA